MSLSEIGRLVHAYLGAMPAAITNGQKGLQTTGVVDGLLGVGAVRYVHPDDFAVYEKPVTFAYRLNWYTTDLAPSFTYYLSAFPVTGFTGVTSSPTPTLGAEVANSRTAVQTVNAANQFVQDVWTPRFAFTGGLLLPVITIANALTSGSRSGLEVALFAFATR